MSKPSAIDVLVGAIQWPPDLLRACPQERRKSVKDASAWNGFWRYFAVIGLVGGLVMPVHAAQDDAAEGWELDGLFEDEPAAEAESPATATAEEPDAKGEPATIILKVEPQEPVRRAPSRAVLEEIIVTAQKRAEDLQTVPLSVTALSGDDITEKNMGDMNEVADYVPNLSLLAVPTFPRVYMRGLGSSFNRGFEQSVAILIDEVFYGRPSYINQGLLDLSAIEVLRGPQGTLFGKNSSAGAIHFRTAMPEFDFDTKADALFGDRNLQRYRIASTGPLTDTVAWRVALLRESRDGSVLNTTTGIDEENRDTWGGRLRLQWDAADDLSLGFTFNASLVNQHGAGTQVIKVRERHRAAMEVFDPRFSDAPYDGLSALDHAGSVARDAYDGTIRADWTLDNDWVVTSLSNYSYLADVVTFDADFSPVPFLILDTNEHMRQYSQELRLTSGPGELQFVTGLYYLHTEVDADYDITNLLELNEILQVTGEGERAGCLNSPDPQGCQDAVLDDAQSGRVAGESIAARMAAQGGPSPVESTLTRYQQPTDSLALFGQASWQFHPRWNLTLGGRLNYEEKSLDVVHRLINNRTGQEGNAVVSGEEAPPGSSYGPGPNPLGASIVPILIAGDTQFSAQRERVDFNVIPKLSLQYDVTDQAMSYLTVARGYKSAGYNAQPVNDRQLEVDEEDAMTYELGIKSEWFGGAARLNVSAFYNAFDGLQVATFNGVSYVVGNAAAATIQGIEYEAMLMTPWGVLLGLNGAFTEATYDSFPGGPCQAEDVSEPPCDLSGAPLRLAPEFTTTFTAGWEGQPFAKPWIVTAGMTASHTGEVVLATDLDPVDFRGAITTYGIQLGLRAADDRWHLTLFGDNVGELDYLLAAEDAPGFRGTHFGGAYPGASYELQLGLRF